MRILAYAIAACGGLAAASTPLLAEPFGEANQDVVQQHNDAYTQGDFDRFLATFADVPGMQASLRRSRMFLPMTRPRRRCCQLPAFTD